MEKKKNSFGLFVTQIQVLILLLLFVSCGGDRQHELSWEEINALEDALLEKNIQASDSLCNIYDALLLSGSLFKFTFQVQETFVQGDRLLCLEGQLLDIIKSDSSYVIKVRRSLWREEGYYFYEDIYDIYLDYIIYIRIRPDTFLDLINRIGTRNHTPNGSFIVQIKRVVSVDPVISSDVEIEGYEGEDSYSYVYIDYRKRIVTLAGDLISYRLNEVMED